MKTTSVLRNLPLVLGIALPLVFILVVLLMAYIPQRALHPAHDFLYTSNTQPYLHAYKNAYHVEKGKLALEPVETNTDMKGVTVDAMPPLYRYDVQTGVVTEVSYEAAQSLTLTSGPTSPDGYFVDYRYNSSGLFDLFGGDGNSSGYYLTKGGAGKALPALSASGYRYNDAVQVIGWVQ